MAPAAGILGVRKLSGTWMTTLADLAAIMTAFFAILLSMSDLPVQSPAAQPEPPSKASSEAQRMAAPLHGSPVSARPDTTYMMALLRERIERSSYLLGYRLERDEGGFRLLLPGLDADAAFGYQTRNLMRTLAALASSRSVRLELLIESAGLSGQEVEAALARARYLARRLQASFELPIDGVMWSWSAGASGKGAVFGLRAAPQ